MHALFKAPEVEAHDSQREVYSQLHTAYSQYVSITVHVWGVQDGCALLQWVEGCALLLRGRAGGLGLARRPLCGSLVLADHAAALAQLLPQGVLTRAAGQWNCLSNASSGLTIKCILRSMHNNCRMLQNTLDLLSRNRRGD